MKEATLFLCAAFLYSGCGKKQAAEYKLTPAQLAWQPYHTGDILRFGHKKDNQVRTYQITEVQDRMETQYRPPSALPLPSGPEPLYQYITVRCQRIDTTAQSFLALDMYLYKDPVYGLELRNEAGWETAYSISLPIDLVNRGVSVDTVLYPGIKLLPSVILGSATYSQAFLVEYRYTGSSQAGARYTGYLYYARNRGVVAFVENGDDMWYRVP